MKKQSLENWCATYPGIQHAFSEYGAGLTFWQNWWPWASASAITQVHALYFTLYILWLASVTTEPMVSTNEL